MAWEYMVREFNVQDSDKILLLEEFLNVAGKDGWELVSVATTYQSCELPETVDVRTPHIV